MKKFITVALVMLIFICPALLLGIFSNTSNGQYIPEQDTGYTIEDYQININVKNDKTMIISEKITVDFNEYSHGIVRWLKLMDNVSYYDNGKLTSKNYKNNITNFQYSYSESSGSTRLVGTYEENGYIFYQMGNSSSYSIGTQTYAFSYAFNSGDDRMKSKDLFYFNIIGTGWDTSIANVDFTITMPTEIDGQEFKFYVGQYGEDNVGGDPRLTYSVEGNTVTGNCRNLAFCEAITVYSEFKNGYFKVSRNVFIDTIIAIATIATVVAFAFFFAFKRKKDPIVEVVEFEAPKGMTPSEVGYLNDGKLTGDDLSSLIVYWASKGYVKIKELEKSYEITKIANLPDDAKKHEKLFFEGLFKDGDVIDTKNLSQLNGELGYKCKKSVEKDMESYFQKSVDKIFNAICVVVAIIYSIMFNKNYFQAYPGILQFVLGIVALLGMCLGITLVVDIVKLKDKISKTKYMIYYILNAVLVLGSIIGFAILMDSYVDAFCARFYLMLLPIVAVLMYPFLELYTEKGREVLGHVRGLRNYIMMAEKDRMEMLVKEDPTLFYSVLPYAYVLGVSDVYMNKFKDVNIAQPEWYYSDNFTTSYFTYRMISNLNFVSTTITKNMISTNIMKTVAKGASTIGRIGGSGHGGGGGFSGGGSGGGGGGRW